MREVCVIGTGLVAFGKYPSKTLAEIGWPAVKEAIVDSGVAPKSIQKKLSNNKDASATI